LSVLPDDLMANLLELLPEAIHTAGVSDVEAVPLAALGLSSMQVVEFATGLEQRFAIEFEPEEFLDLPGYDLTGLARVIDAKVDGDV
jgi:acyl carrier protein